MSVMASLSKVCWANMGPHVGPMNFALWVCKSLETGRFGPQHVQTNIKEGIKLRNTVPL